MTPIKQYNEYACAAACLESFLRDAAEKLVDHKKDIVGRQYTQGFNPFQVGTGNEGSLLWGILPSSQTIALALSKGFDPQKLARDEDYRKDFYQSLSMDEFKILPADLRNLHTVAEALGVEITGVHYLPEATQVGNIPEDETYLILTTLLGNERVSHSLRWQGKIESGVLELMDPKVHWKERDGTWSKDWKGDIVPYHQDHLWKAKCLFVRLRIKKTT